MGKFLEVAAERPRGLNWEVMNLATHTGVVKGDATNLSLPYNDNEFFGVYSEHFIEHLFSRNLNCSKPSDSSRLLASHVL